MHIETICADWIKDQQFLLQDHAGFPVVMAQPNGVSGADLLPMSLAGCAAWDILSILQKQRQQVTHFEVLVDSERDEEPPWRFRKMRVHYRFSGHNLGADQVQRAIQLAETRYCSIYATLRDAVEISSDYEVADESN